MSDMIDYLWRSYDKCESDIKALKKEKKKNEDAYESLIRFKQNVDSSAGEFQSAISTRKEFLSILDSVEKWSAPVEKYHKGMNDVLGGIGGKTVLRVFNWMESHIEKEKRSYRDKIKEIEREILKKRNRQEDILREISTIETREAEEV